MIYNNILIPQASFFFNRKKNAFLSCRGSDPTPLADCPAKNARFFDLLPLFFNQLLNIKGQSFIFKIFKMSTVEGYTEKVRLNYFPAMQPL